MISVDVEQWQYYPDAAVSVGQALAQINGTTDKINVPDWQEHVPDVLLA